MKTADDVNKAYKEFLEAHSAFTTTLRQFIEDYPEDPRCTEIFTFIANLQSEVGEWEELLAKWGTDEVWFPGGNFIFDN